MKLSKHQLRQIIKEEMQQLREAGEMGPIPYMQEIIMMIADVRSAVEGKGPYASTITPDVRKKLPAMIKQAEDSLRVLKRKL